MKKIVVMPGGFHPFHAGHAALYQSAVKAFPDAEVYVAATNDTKSRPFPFSIKEKLAKLAGVAPGHFIQVKSPFKAEEITSHYNPNEDVLIFVRSEKDKTEQPKPGGMKKDGTPAYFQPYTGKNLQPFSQHAYMAYLPTVEFGPGITSASEIRAAWPTLNDKRKTAMVMSLYPTTQKNPKLAANVVKMLDMGMGGELDEDINRRGFLKGMGAAAVAGAPSIAKAYDFNFKDIGSWNIQTTKSKFGDPTNMVAFNNSLVYDGRRLYYYIGNGESRPWTKIAPNSLVKYMIDGGKIQNTTSSSTGSVDFTSDISLIVKASKLDIQYTYINLLKRNSDKSEVEIQVSGLGKVIEYFKNPDQYDKKEKFQQDKQDREEKEKSDREAQAKELKRQQDLEVERKRREEEMRPEMERQAKVRKIESELYQYNKQVSTNILNNFQQMLGNKLKDISNVQNVDATIQVDKNGNISNVDVGPNAHAEKLFGWGGVSSYDRVRMGKDAYDLLKNPKFYNGLFTNIPPDLFQAAMDENGLMTINLNLGNAGYNSQNKLGGKITIPKLRDLGIRSNFNINESVEQGVAEGLSLHDVAWIGNLVPSFMQRIASAGTREAKQTAILSKILGKWVATGELTPGEEAFAKQQLIDIAKMIAGMAVASAVTASAPAHAAATAVASGVTHIAQHGAVDLGLDALAVMLSKNFKFDFLKKIMHSLETDSGKAYSHVEKKQSQAPKDDVDKQVNQQFQKAKMGFGGMSEEINEMLGFKIVKTPNKTTKQTTSLADMRKEFEKDKSTNLKKYSNNTDTKNPKYVRTVAAEENMAEAGSNAMASTASRLTNKNDGKVAKLRAAGDRRREDQLKGRDIAKSDKTSNDEWGDVKESTSLSVEQLAQISDKALDDAYHYGRSTPGANFGWMANLQSAKAAKRLIDAGETDIEKISDAIHKGWNVTAAADYKGQLQLDTPTPDEKKLKRAKLAMQSYAQLPEEEKEKDRVVARALLSALGGKVDEEFGINYPGTYEQENGPFTHKGGLRTTSLTTESADYLDEK